MYIYNVWYVQEHGSVSYVCLCGMGTEGHRVGKTVLGTLGQELVFTAKPGCGHPQQGCRVGVTRPYPPHVKSREPHPSPALALCQPGCSGGEWRRSQAPGWLLSLSLREGQGQEAPESLYLPLCLQRAAVTQSFYH